MAACIRLKLNFDGSVCPQIPQRKCWFLVNKDNCNVVADLEYLIRERFELDRSQILSLSLDSYVLPSMEKIHVVRDNDTIWVHAEQTDDIVDDLQVSEPTTPLSESVTEVSFENEQHSTTQQIRKRKCSDVTEETSQRKLIHRETLDGEGLDNERSSNKSIEVSVLQMDKESQPKKNHSKKKKKNKKKKSLEPDERPKTPSSKSSGSSKKDNSKQKSCGKSITSHNRSPRISSNSEKKNKSKKQEDRSPSSDCASKVSSTCSKSKSYRVSTYDLRKRLASSPVSSTKTSGTLSAITPVTSAEHVENETIKSPTGLLLTVEKNHVREKKRSAAPVILSSGHIRFQSSESEVSSDDDSDVDNEKQTSKQSDTSKQSETSKQSDREQTDKVQPGTDETFIRRDQPVAQNGSSFQSPVPTPSEECNHGAQSFQNNGQFKRQNSSSPHQTGCNSRGKGSDSWRWDRGNWDKDSQLNTTQSNKSFVIENPPQESEPVPKDFTSFPSLVGPPRLGDVIAYKILELSESYCPELSNFKEGKVLSVDTATSQIEIELSHLTMVTRASKLGKFDLLWGDEEGDGDNEMNVTNNNSVDLHVSVQLGDLVDPRLVPPMSV